LAKYQGQWVAFTKDGEKIVAGSEDLATLDNLVISMGQNPEEVAYEFIELDDTYLGGAEFD
jgi:hypothetical protein